MGGKSRRIFMTSWMLPVGRRNADGRVFGGEYPSQVILKKFAIVLKQISPEILSRHRT